ncbi:hypothetical protein ACL1G3_09750, partial [Corynebacterium striatum]
TQHQRIVVPPTSTMKENPLQYRVRGTPVPTTRTRGTNYPKSTVRIELQPTDGQALTEDYLDHLGERLLEIFFAVMTDFPEVCFFSILEPD